MLELDFKELLRKLRNLEKDMHRTIIQGITSGKVSIILVQVQRNN
jgi:hypothetical protein